MAQYGESLPFPYNVIDLTGSGFALGAIGSSPFHYIRAPQGARLDYVRMRALRTGGAFAAWSALYGVASGGLEHVRGKEDPWNSIWAGGSAAGLLSVRQGLRVASRQFLTGAVTMALIEGVMIKQAQLQEKLKAQAQAQAQDQSPGSVPIPDSPEAKPGFFRRWFGDKKDEKEGGTKVLESLDTPTAMPTFAYSQ